MTNRLACVLLLVLPVIACGLANAAPDSTPKPAAAPRLVKIDFESRPATAASSGDVELLDATLDPRGRTGSAVRLDPALPSPRLILKKPLSTAEGTISFWVKPAGSGTGSQPLLALRWGESSESYLAISQGWWEPLGRDRLYFIVSNQDAMHCSVERKLDPDTWQLLTVTWKTGRPGLCRVFIDGLKVAEHLAAFVGSYRSTGPMYLGSDLATTNLQHRRASALMDELYVYPNAFSEQDVRLLHEKAVGGAGAAEQLRWSWLKTELERLPADGSLSGPPAQSRVLFDESWQWARSKRDVERTLERVKRAGFNVYVPCVWHGAGTYFPTRSAHLDPRLAQAIEAGFDPLAYLIERAHALGIEVHAWFTVVRRDDTRWPQFYEAGVPANAYDVHNEAFREFIVELILDTARRYRLDGLNLDYIRAMGVCVSEHCQQDYRSETGRDLLADMRSTGIEESQASLRRWQDAAVAKIVMEVAQGTQDIGRRIVISVDGHPQVDSSRRGIEGRDELAWIRNGWVDVVFNMSYGQRIDFDRVAAVARSVGVEGRSALLISNFDRIDGKPVPRPAAAVAGMVAVSSARWPNAPIGIYLANMLTHDQSDALRRRLFREDVPTLWPTPHVRDTRP